MSQSAGDGKTGRGARDEAAQRWLTIARREAEAGFAELDRGQGICATAAEHMARIDAAVRARVGK